jgi:hypothetical protein
MTGWVGYFVVFIILGPQEVSTSVGQFFDILE